MSLTLTLKPYIYYSKESASMDACRRCLVAYSLFFESGRNGPGKAFCGLRHNASAYVLFPSGMPEEISINFDESRHNKNEEDMVVHMNTRDTNRINVH